MKRRRIKVKERLRKKIENILKEKERMKIDRKVTKKGWKKEKN